MAKGKQQLSDTDVIIERARENLEKQFGSGVVRWGNELAPNRSFVSTQSWRLDAVLGGGIPIGRVTMIAGSPSGGKTTIALHTIAEAQSKDPDCKCLFVDVENTFDRMYAEAIGVDMNRLLISQVDIGEEALEIYDQLIRTGAFRVAVLDSIMALLPKKMMEQAIGESNAMGLRARLLADALPRISSAVNKSNTAGIIINQLRANLSPYGASEQIPGGFAVKFYSSNIILVRRIESKDRFIINADGEIIGAPSAIKIPKAKAGGLAFAETEIDILTGKGIDRTAELLYFGERLGIICKKGAFWYFADTNEMFAQGKEAARAYIENNAELRSHIIKAIEDKIYGNSQK